MLDNEAKDELQEIIGIEQEIDRDDLIYKRDNGKRYKMFGSQRSKTIWSLLRDIWSGVITLDHAHKEQVNKNWLCLQIILKDIPGQKIKTIRTGNK